MYLIMVMYISICFPENLSITTCLRSSMVNTSDL